MREILFRGKREDSGEPYEEPTQDARTDRERLQPLLYTMPGYRGRTGEGADYLIAHGVTFRERL